MERELRAWLRYSIPLGMYMSPTIHVYESTTNASNKLAQCRKTPGSTVTRGKRLAWLPNSRTDCLPRLKRIYLHALLPWICALYVNGLVQRKPVPGTMLSWLVATLFFTSQALSNLLIVAEGIWRLQDHEAFLMLLQEIELSLKLRLRQDIRERWLVGRVRFLLKYLLWFSFGCGCLFVYNFEDLQYIGYFHFSIWFAITMRLRLIQLLIYIRVLHHYMECLCIKLQQIVAFRMAPTLQLMDINYDKLQSVECLVAIREIYSLLFRAFQLLNDFAGWSLFSIIVCYMLDYGCTLYWALLSWEGYLERRNYYVACFWWLFPMTAIVWQLCYICDSCKRLDRSIAAQLSKILVIASSRSLYLYRIFVHQFSTQLQLQYIKVSAKNFFALDMHLIMAIFTSIATYLIIIIQFLGIK